MELIRNGLVLLSFIVFVCALVGLVSAASVKLSSRWKAVGVWIVSVLLLGIGAACKPDEATQRNDDLIDRLNEIVERAEREALAPPQLELLNYSGTVGEYGYATVEGQVKNISGQRMENVMAVVTWFTDDDSFVTSDEALIAYNPVMPGQTSPFEVLTQANPMMKKFSVTFKEIFGDTIKVTREDWSVNP